MSHRSRVKDAYVEWDQWSTTLAELSLLYPLPNVGQQDFIDEVEARKDAAWDAYLLLIVESTGRRAEIKAVGGGPLLPI